MTIVEAVKQVMRERGRPMTVAEVYDAIIAQALYSFNADGRSGASGIDLWQIMADNALGGSAEELPAGVSNCVASFFMRPISRPHSEVMQ